MVFSPQTKVRGINVHIEDMKHIMYTDHMWQFSVVSNQGNRYIMVLYKTDGNLILLHNEKYARHMSFFTKWTKTKLKSNSWQWSIRRVSPNDKKASYWIPKSFPTHGSAKCKKKTISMFRDHFKAILGGVDKTFPIFLWDWLLPQAESTLNMLWPTNIAPKISAYA